MITVFPESCTVALPANFSYPAGNVGEFEFPVFVVVPVVVVPVVVVPVGVLEPLPHARVVARANAVTASWRTKAVLGLVVVSPNLTARASKPLVTGVRAPFIREA